MPFVFDPKKDEANRIEHGLSFSDFDGFDSEPVPVSVNDDRADYGEVRQQTFGRINGKGHMVVTTERAGNARLISFRRARDKELRRYGL